jgi:hypothetical protein
LSGEHTWSPSGQSSIRSIHLKRQMRWDNSRMCLWWIGWIMGCINFANDVTPRIEIRNTTYTEILSRTLFWDFAIPITVNIPLNPFLGSIAVRL